MEYAGAAYHVMARGNQGRPIYADDFDRMIHGPTPLQKLLSFACLAALA